MSPLSKNGRSCTSKIKPNVSHSLKSKENKFKCNKLLKKKLRKYKLRKDGQEDPDIIDVSLTLITALKIKSPNNKENYAQKLSEENRSCNYLTNMVRMKRDISVMESTPITCISDANQDECIFLTPIEDQDKKQTDAFKLLMDSRNKSIGSNSPGKEKMDKTYEVPNKVQKSELKTKRILSLNKMAEAKGSLKKIEIEQCREEYIKRKMEDRAKRLKCLIVDKELKNIKKDKITATNENEKVVKSKSKKSIPVGSGVSEKEHGLTNKTSIFKTIDIFKDIKENPKNDLKKNSKEDEEFLSKLSPSIRKKENMLSYFQKVNRDSDSLQINDATSISPQHKEQVVIKVKLKSRNKDKKKKNKDITDKEIKASQKHNNCDFIDISKKRKRNENNDSYKEKIVNKNMCSNNMFGTNDSRPKRNTKKPVKYSDNYQLTSSDEELHIFTPKKKRKHKINWESNLETALDNSKQHLKLTKTMCSNEIDSDLNSNKRKIGKKKPLNAKNGEHSVVMSKKITKLAPIFVPKPQIDSATIEARQRFLQSGVPNQLKKISINQSSRLVSDEFQTVVHIQNLTHITYPQISNTCNLSDFDNYSQDIHFKEKKDLFNKLLQVSVSQNYSLPNLPNNVKQILQDIKVSYPKFPVYRTYHLLRGKSKGELKNYLYPDFDNSLEILHNYNMVDTNNIHPDNLNWVDKYKPVTEKQVIGNFESIKELRQWLVSWTENNVKLQRNKDSDSDDFYHSDTDSRETVKSENNLLIITGKVGTGKTLSVYAVAAELAIKVIEVNASTKRTGKVILQDLQEATQSHKVNRAKNFTECLPKEQETCNDFLKVIKKRGRKSKANGNSMAKPAAKNKSSEVMVLHDNTRTGMSLILIDDADIVFDQDDGFCYAISQLIQSSKRPVILVTSSLTCPHLQKFTCLAKVIKMRPLLPRMLGTWLDIMCLADNNACSPGLGAMLLDLFKGDIRKTINYLQFYMTSHKYMSDINVPEVLQSEEVFKINGDDENSCMSWGDNEGVGEIYRGSSNSNDIYQYFLRKESQILEHFWGPLQKFQIWWNLPNFLNYNGNCCDYTIDKLCKSKKIKETIYLPLNEIANVLDYASITDYFEIFSEKPNITSNPWQSFETDSVVNNENFADYDRYKNCINEISQELMMKGITEAQKFTKSEDKNKCDYTSMILQRERDRVVSRHKSLTNSLNPSTCLDRRALALDYWSSCRSICRTEKSKTDNNNKRNNRFCHYLKSLNIDCKNDYFDKLGDSLCFKK